MTLPEKACWYAKECHNGTNHKYDGKPYVTHLRIVVDYAKKYAHHIDPDHLDMVLASCWTHDVIEDCRQTYNDVSRVLGERVAHIVYALTNEKGRNRKERANEKYYAGIRATDYATFVKLCDRLANVRYSFENGSGMMGAYRKEHAGFVSYLHREGEYEDMWEELNTITNKTLSTL